MARRVSPLSASRTTVCRPACPAKVAALAPAGPPPTMTRSYMLLSSLNRRLRRLYGQRTAPGRSSPTLASVAAEIDGVDLDRVERDHDPALAGPVHLAEVGAVLLPDLVREGVVWVRADLGARSDFEIPHRVGPIQDEQRAGRFPLQVLGLLPSRVQRDLQRVLVEEEPEGGHLREPIRADGRQRRDVGGEQV